MPAVFLLHLSKQVTQGCNREMTPKKTVFSNYFVNKTQNLMAKLSWSKQVNVPVFILHPGKQVTQGCNRGITPKKPYFSNNFVHETQNLIAKQSQNRQMNAPVFLLHLGKQVTQGCNREISPKKLNGFQILFFTIAGNKVFQARENDHFFSRKGTFPYRSFSFEYQGQRLHCLWMSMQNWHKVRMVKVL